ncbi:MAG: hypothetical protein AAGI38_22110 [Bacteroidota bacterium]
MGKTAADPDLVGLWEKVLITAENFRQLAPWNWMSTEDLYGIQNPVSGRFAYCCVMGSSGNSPGLVLFHGAIGLRHFENFQHREEGETDTDPPELQHCWHLSFGNKEDLFSSESVYYKSLPGTRPNIPLIREYTEGMSPWNLSNEKDLEFMLQVLEQTIEVCLRFKYDQDILERQAVDGTYLLLRTYIELEGIGLWQDEWEAQHALKPGTTEANKLYLRSNCFNLPVNRGTTWAIDLFFLPSTKKTNQGRGYQPRMLLVLDRDQGCIIGQHIFVPSEVFHGLQFKIKEYIVKKQYRPETILTTSHEAFEALEGICNVLQIKIKKQLQGVAGLRQIKETLIQANR